MMIGDDGFDQSNSDPMEMYYRMLQAIQGQQQQQGQGGGGGGLIASLLGGKKQGSYGGTDAGTGASYENYSGGFGGFGGGGGFA